MPPLVWLGSKVSSGGWRAYPPKSGAGPSCRLPPTGPEARGGWPIFGLASIFDFSRCREVAGFLRGVCGFAHGFPPSARGFDENVRRGGAA